MWLLMAEPSMWLLWWKGKRQAGKSGYPRSQDADSNVADQAFEALKKQLAEPPVLAAPIDKEPFLLYVAANS